MPRIAPQLLVSARMRRILEAKARAPTTSQQLAERMRIVSKSLDGQLNQRTAKQLGVDPQRVSRWRRRWSEVQDRLQEAEHLTDLFKRLMGADQKQGQSRTKHGMPASSFRLSHLVQAARQRM